jgi:hypothetical protein
MASTSAEVVREAGEKAGEDASGVEKARAHGGGFEFGFETGVESAKKEEVKGQSSGFDFFGGFEAQQVS